MKPTIYIETSVISYLTSRPSRDLIVAGHQQITREWWNAVRPKVDCFVSPFVIQELNRGNQEAAQKRLAAIEGFSNLLLNENIKVLAQRYFVATPIPEKAIIDAFHLAFPCWYEIDYLLTWNCKHIANGSVRKIIKVINDQFGIYTPVVCTPEELMEI